jgi:hypothetical protein
VDFACIQDRWEPMGSIDCDNRHAVVMVLIVEIDVPLVEVKLGVEMGTEWLLVEISLNVEMGAQRVVKCPNGHPIRWRCVCLPKSIPHGQWWWC